MKLKQKIWLYCSAVIALIVVVDAFSGYRNVDRSIREELLRDAKDIRGILMATRRVYHQQFLDSGLPLDDKTLGFLPAHAMLRISQDFPNWNQDGLFFNNVSDRPRNPANQADADELKAIAWFRANPQEKERLSEISGRNGQSFYHYTTPIWVEAYCLTCHGARENAPASVATAYDAAYDYQVGDLRGVLSIKLPTETVRQRELSAWYGRFTFRLFGYLALLLLLGFFLNRVVIRRLGQLQQTADAIAAGHYTERAPVYGDDELGSLGRTFNHMAEAIEQRNLLDQALQQSEQKFSTIFRNSPDLIAITERNSGRFLEVNEAFTRIMGYPPTEVIGRSSSDLGTWGDAGCRQAMLDALGDNSRLLNHETLFRRQNGEIFPALLSLEAKRIGNTDCLIMTARDITERVKAEQALADYGQHLESMVAERTAQLEAARQEAVAGSLAKSAFLSNMSHEIRTPMNAIIGLSHLLLKDSISDGQRQRIHKMQGAADHLLAIINDILDLSKIEAGRVQLERLPFSLSEVVGNIGSLLADPLRAKGIGYHVDIAELPEHLVGDKTRIAQCLLNYVGNALKFTTSGQITLRGEVLEQTASDCLLRFTVTDTGIGIAPDKQGNLFHAFEQADSSTTRRFGGTGLGLAINKHLAQLMGGEVGMFSREGEGSSFWISMRLGLAGPTPVSAPVSHGKEAAPTPESVLRQHYRHCRLLLVEDEPINQEVAFELLHEEAGLEVDLADSGEQAIELARHTPYDLILMDVQMPGVDGLAATAAIRQLAGYRETPILAVTANAFDDDKQRCLAAGMNGHVSKPVDPDKLFETLLHWLAVTQRKTP